MGAGEGLEAARANGVKLEDFMPYLSDFDRLLLTQIKEYGGARNRHAHLDRSGTLASKYLGKVHRDPLDVAVSSLKAKQAAVGNVHRDIGYTEKDLYDRMKGVLERLVWWGTVQVDTCIDQAEDIEEQGLLALRVALQLKKEFAGRLDLNVGSYAIFGISRPARWEMFVNASEQADFICTLPEKDDGELDGKIGFPRHFRKAFELACRLKKEIHLHLDQADNPNEYGTERLIHALEGYVDSPQIPNHEGPTVWAVHMISPSAYPEPRFAKLVEGLIRYKVGVIVCPTAAVSMRRLRPIKSPTHNSIARILELCKRGVPVRLGTDNIDDFFVPGGDGFMHTEAKMAAHSVRFYFPHIWAALVAGKPLNNFDLDTIGKALYQDSLAFSGINPKWRPAVS